MGAAGKGVVEKVIGNADPRRGRVGANLAGALLDVIGVAFTCIISGDAAARPEWGGGVGKDVVERNHDFIIANATPSTCSAV
eukprot:3059277-Pyramimonas_sp.AAC.1